MNRASLGLRKILIALSATIALAGACPVSPAHDWTVDVFDHQFGLSIWPAEPQIYPASVEVHYGLGSSALAMSSPQAYAIGALLLTATMATGLLVQKARR